MEAGIEIAGSRIVIIKPDTAYWAGRHSLDRMYPEIYLLQEFRKGGLSGFRQGLWGGG